MKISHALVPLVLAAAVTVRAQSGDPTTVVTPKSPAPVATAPVATAPGTRAPDRIIYAQRLPTAADLTAVAAAQKMVISKIEIAATQVAVTWQAEGAQPITVIYRPLSSVSAATGSQDTVYREPPRVIYYDDYYPAYYGYPYWYPSFSFGFRGGFGGRHGRWH